MFVHFVGSDHQFSNVVRIFLGNIRFIKAVQFCFC